MSFVRFCSRRVQLKVERIKDSQLHAEWSKKHGHDTYGHDNDDLGCEVDVEVSVDGVPWVKGNAERVGQPHTNAQITRTVLRKRVKLLTVTFYLRMQTLRTQTKTHVLWLWC